MKPDYGGGSIVNLMSSIGSSFGWNSDYKELKLLPSGEIKKNNVILMVIDGLGYDYVLEKSRVMKKYLKGRITSVFPTTTVAAITTFKTGMAPQQHAMTGWKIYLNELKKPVSIFKDSEELTNILGVKNFPSRINADSYELISKDIADSSYTFATSKGSEIITYKSINGYFRRLGNLIKKPGRKFIYAYWPKFDEMCHKYGKRSKRASEHLIKFETKLKKFIGQLEDTILIITSDHGHMDTQKNRVFDPEDWLEFLELLKYDLCGDTRTVYCYVKNKKEFEKYVKNNLSHIFEIYKSKELVKKHYFGLGKEHEKLRSRIGDYTLIAKEKWAISNKNDFYIGHHSGTSKEEMEVPLIVINEKV